MRLQRCKERPNLFFSVADPGAPWGPDRNNFQSQVFVLLTGTSWLVPGPDDNETGEVRGMCPASALLVVRVCQMWHGFFLTSHKSRKFWNTVFCNVQCRNILLGVLMGLVCSICPQKFYLWLRKLERDRRSRNVIALQRRTAARMTSWRMRMLCSVLMVTSAT